MQPIDAGDFARLETEVKNISRAISDLREYLRKDYLKHIETRVTRLETDVEHLTAELKAVMGKVWITSGAMAVLVSLTVGLIMKFLTS